MDPEQKSILIIQGLIHLTISARIMNDNLIYLIGIIPKIKYRNSH